MKRLFVVGVVTTILALISLMLVSSGYRVVKLEKLLTLVSFTGAGVGYFLYYKSLKSDDEEK